MATLDNTSVRPIKRPKVDATPHRTRHSVKRVVGPLAPTTYLELLTGDVPLVFEKTVCRQLCDLWSPAQLAQGVLAGVQTDFAFREKDRPGIVWESNCHYHCMSFLQFTAWCASDVEAPSTNDGSRGRSPVRTSTHWGCVLNHTHTKAMNRY